MRRQWLIVLLVLLVTSAALVGDDKPAANVLRWSAGAPESSLVTDAGVERRTLKVGGLSVGAAVRDVGKRLLGVDLRIVNIGEAPVQFSPDDVTLEVITPKAKRLSRVDPEKFARKIENEDAQMEHGVFFDRNAMGAAASGQPVARKQRTTITLEGRDYPLAEYVRKMAFKPDPIEPKRGRIGLVYFEREKKRDEVLVRVTLGDHIFEFPLEGK